jgi:DNA-binding LacI/PurR family transcriptional regulator
VNHVVQAFNAPDADCVLRFSHVSVVPDRPLEVRQYLPEEIWHGIRARAYSLIVALGVAPIAMRRIEELHGPVVSFGTSSAFSLRLAMLEACQLGVAELTKRARRIALYHTPYISMREVFVAALRAHGVEEAFRPHPLPLSVNSAEFLVRPQNLVELGWHTARSVFSAAESEWPDAVLSLDDMFTQGYILGLEDIGIDWRRRCQIATYANEDSPVLTPWDRHLILMSFSTRELAERMRRGAEEIQRSGAPEKGWENFDHSDPKFNERYELIRCRLTVPEKL